MHREYGSIGYETVCTLISGAMSPPWYNLGLKFAVHDVVILRSLTADRKF